MRTPARPPLDGLKKRLDQSRAERARMPRDGFLRETFLLPRSDARLKAKEWFERCMARPAVKATWEPSDEAPAPQVRAA